MAAEDYPALTLIPRNQTPSPDILSSGGNDHVSDIFPHYKTDDVNGVLGDYRVGQPSRASPLWPIIEGLGTHRTNIFQQENTPGSTRTSETRTDLITTRLHIHLAESIEGAYRNLLAKNWDSAEALLIIATHIHRKDKVLSDLYNLRLDRLYRQLASLEQGEETAGNAEDSNGGIPAISLTMLEATELSPEAQHILRKARLLEEMRETRRRIGRLKFEWLSATVILQLLKKGITVQEDTA